MVAPALLQPRWFSSCSPHAPSSPRLLPAAAEALHRLAPRCACGDQGRNCELLGCSPPTPPHLGGKIPLFQIGKPPFAGIQSFLQKA